MFSFILVNLNNSPFIALCIFIWMNVITIIYIYVYKPFEDKKINRREMFVEIGFIFTYLAPMYYNVKGIVYREIFGLQFQAVEGNTPVNDDIFTA